MPQRLWYDQLLLYMVPDSPVEMFTLVIGSWIVITTNNLLGWQKPFASQDHRAQILVVVLLYLPLAFFKLKKSGIVSKWYRRFFQVTV
jgi:hypothetical protein